MQNKISVINKFRSLALPFTCYAEAYKKVCRELTLTSSRPRMKSNCHWIPWLEVVWRSATLYQTATLGKGLVTLLYQSCSGGRKLVPDSTGNPVAR